jgi:hypothetical protein
VLGVRVHVVGFRGQGSRFRDQGLGFRVECLRVSGQGLGFRV